MILSIDPGGTTGVASITRGGQFNTIQVGDGADGFFDWWGKSLLSEGLDAVVCETFIPRPGAKSTQLDALHVIGMLRYWCRKYGVPLIMQSPAQAKSFATNDKLKAAGWYVVGEDHGRDAARHLLVFLVTHHPVVLAQYVQKRADTLAALVAS